VMDTIQEMLLPALDPTEAPEGYVAVLKADARPRDGGNICRACDWRPRCQDPATNFGDHRNRCMDFAVSDGGRMLRRHDGCSVVFKRACNLPNVDV